MRKEFYVGKWLVRSQLGELVGGEKTVTVKPGQTKSVVLDLTGD